MSDCLMVNRARMKAHRAVPAPSLIIVLVVGAGRDLSKILAPTTRA